MAERGLPRKVALEDGRIATIAFLSENDSVREIRSFINAFVEQGSFLLYDRKISLEDEAKWKAERLADFRRGNGQVLVARVGGRIAGTCDARRERFKGRGNVSLGIAIASGYRGIGLGEALLRLNIETARKRQKPRNIFLTVLGPNKPARALYRKVGFRELAVLPKWVLQDGKYVDHIFMILKRKPDGGAGR